MQLSDDSLFCSACGVPQARQDAPAGVPAVSPASPVPAGAPAAAGPIPAAFVPGPYPPPVPGAVRHSLKTSADTVCGIFFLLLGGGALCAYGFYLAEIAAAPSPLYWLVPLLGGFTGQALAATLLSLGTVLGFVAGGLLILAGLFALKSGKGHKPAYTGLVLMLFVLLTDILYYCVMAAWGHILPPLGTVLMQGAVIYAFECLFAVALMILLPVKRAAKKRRKQRVAAAWWAPNALPAQIILTAAPAAPGPQRGRQPAAAE